MFQLTYLQAKILSDQFFFFCKAHNSPLSEGTSMISSDRKKRKFKISISELTLKENVKVQNKISKPVTPLISLLLCNCWNVHFKLLKKRKYIHLQLHNIS